MKNIDGSSRKRKSADKWADCEVQALLSYWGQESIQQCLESGNRRNERVFLDISTHLETLGFIHTAVQVREKLKKLKQDYKKTKDHNNRSGSWHKTGKWYDWIDSILGHRPPWNVTSKGSARRPQTLTTIVKEEVDAPSTSAVSQSGIVQLHR